MRPKPESRREISDAIKRRGQNLDDRLRHLELVVQDKKTVCDTAKQLRLATTSEGEEEIRRAIADAAKATGKEFQRQNAKAEAAMARCDKAAKDLHRRTQDAQQNATAMRSAADNTKESKSARRYIVHGQHEARRDAQYLDAAAKSQEDKIRSTAYERDQQKQEIRNAILKIRENPPSPYRMLNDLVTDPPPGYGLPAEAGRRYEPQLSKIRRNAGDGGAARNLDGDSIPPDELEKQKELIRRSQEGHDPSDPQREQRLPMDDKDYIKEVETYKKKYE